MPDVHGPRAIARGERAPERWNRRSNVKESTMPRRTASLGAVGFLLSVVFLARTACAAPGAGASVAIEEGRIRVETPTLSAVFEKALLVSLVRKSDRRQLVRASPRDTQGVYLIYPFGEAVPFGNRDTDRFTPHRINDLKAEFRIEGFDGDGVMRIEADPATGDLVVELGLASSRPGVRSCRWLLAGIDPELDLIAPFFQGVRVRLEDPLVHNTFWNWPHRWESPLAILQGPTGGLWVHARDTRPLYKNIQVGRPGDPRCLGFDTDAFGPLDHNLSAGGLAWRVNVYDGDWRVPAARYRKWLAETYALDKVARPPWVNDITLSVVWCPPDTAILDALSRRIDPRRVLIHISDFTSFRGYGNFPDFTPSEQGRAFFRKGLAMGFHIMPHFPALDIDPAQPAYDGIRDFQYRELENKKLVGWTSAGGEGPVPESHAARVRAPAGSSIMRMHPGLGMWRSILSENILKTVEDLNATEVFLDVTMNTHNVDNAWVEGRTPTEGMIRLEETIADLGHGLVLGGEGRNEVTMRSQAFGQVHLFKSWFTNIPGLDRLTMVPLGEFLYGEWCRAFGYARLSGATPEEALRMKLQLNQGAVPTITVRSAAEIDNPNAAVLEMFDRANRMAKERATGPGRDR
jgi:hypothetical protein